MYFSLGECPLQPLQRENAGGIPRFLRLNPTVPWIADNDLGCDRYTTNGWHFWAVSINKIVLRSFSHPPKFLTPMCPIRNPFYGLRIKEKELLNLKRQTEALRTTAPCWTMRLRPRKSLNGRRFLRSIWTTWSRSSTVSMAEF